MKRIEFLGHQNWTDVSTENDFGMQGEIVWQYNVENGTAYACSYHGDDYKQPSLELDMLDLFLNKSSDGMTWEPIDTEHP